MKLSTYIKKFSTPLPMPLIGYPGIRMINATIKDVLLSEDKHYCAIEAIYKRFKPPGIFPLMDLTIEAGAFGLSIEYPRNDVAYVKNHPLRAGDDLTPIKTKDILSAPRVKGYLNVIRKLANTLPGLHGGFLIGPFSLAGLFMGVEKLAMAIMDNPEFIRRLIDVLTHHLQRLAVAQVESGADIIAILEPTAMLVSAAQFDKFVKPAIQKTIEGLESMTLLHICGNSNHLIEEMAGTGVQGLSLDHHVDFLRAKDLVPPKIILWGNLDPISVFHNGTYKTVKDKTEDFLIRMKNVDNFVASTGCDLPLSTPLENIQAFFDSVNEWKGEFK